MNVLILELGFENPKKTWLTPTAEVISSVEINNYSISHSAERVVIAHGTKLFYGS